MSLSPSRLLLGILFASIALAGGCTVNGDQCQTAADCTSVFDGPVDQLQCVQGVCGRRGPTFSTDAGSIERKCATTEDCTTDGGAPSFCREERCVDIFGGGVQEVSPNFQSGRPIFIGAIAATTFDGPEGPVDRFYDKTNMDGIRLATSDWITVTETNAVAGGPVRRPLVTVLCNSAGFLERQDACFDHMTNVLRAPVVLLRSDDQAKALLPRAIERKVVLYCTDCESRNFTAAETQGFLRFGFGSLMDTFPLRARWVERLEQQVRTERALGAAEPTKAVVITPSTQPTIGKMLFDQIRLNGKSAQENGEAKNLLHVVLDRTTFVDYRSVAKTIVSFGAHIVLVQGLGHEFHFNVMPEIEANWPGSEPRPFYIAGADEAFPTFYERSVGSNEELRRRVTGIQYNVEDRDINENFHDFIDRFKSSSALGYDPNGIATGFESYYVSAYALTAALNMSTTNPDNISGTDFLEGLKRLVAAPGAKVLDVRASTIVTGITTLRDGQPLDLRGLNSQLEWDPQTGAVAMNASVYCLKRSSRNFTLEELWVYDAFTGPIGEPNLLKCDP